MRKKKLDLIIAKYLIFINYKLFSSSEQWTCTRGRRGEIEYASPIFVLHHHSSDVITNSSFLRYSSIIPSFFFTVGYRRRSRDWLETVRHGIHRTIHGPTSEQSLGLCSRLHLRDCLPIPWRVSSPIIILFLGYQIRSAQSSWNLSAVAALLPEDFFGLFKKDLKNVLMMEECHERDQFWIWENLWIHISSHTYTT